jgi:hypothetical protein
MHHHVLHESCAESQAEPPELQVQQAAGLELPAGMVLLVELAQPAESAVLSAQAQQERLPERQVQP